MELPPTKRDRRVIRYSYNNVVRIPSKNPMRPPEIKT
jgi:hypothetical protein